MLFEDFNNNLFSSVNGLEIGNGLYENIELKRRLYTSIFYGAFLNVLGNSFNFTNMDIKKENDLKKSYMYSNFVGYYSDYMQFLPLTPEGERNYFFEYNDFIPLYNTINVKFNINDNKNIVGFNKSFNTVVDNAICVVYATRVAELIISIDNAVLSSRILNVFAGSENQLKELQDVFQRLNSGIPYLFVKEIGQINNFKSIQLQKPDSITSFYEGYSNIINEFLMVTGLNSLIFPNKKERMITDEAITTNDIKSTILQDKYKNRLDFLNKINDNHGTDYGVEFNVNVSDDLQMLIDPGSFINTEGGE